ncbi:hypothetical protein [Flavobacterium gilvum]|uniref:Uncharacterized protein n=1 Tax=Flavobacterium gilvum TaxID=1492737 RepID=A0AAC9N6N3_9FLAO|nr:hypothetical protein [Flavobacterium gilvum]AOW09103.1 hypothetical protein EM308_06055 [Flavobacterium gilvum]KFC60662.1 hypothetical protein FEM08_07040 [Flavobacterium gilvum]
MKTTLLVFLWSFSLIAQIDVKQDKLAHFGAGALVSSLSYVVIYKHTKSAPKSLLYSTACAFLVGTAKECYDIKHGREGFGVEDLLVTTFGGFVTSSFITIAIKDKGKQKQLEKIKEFKKEEQQPIEIPLAVRTEK